MTRLNNTLREKMVHKALTLAGIDRDLDDLAARRAALAEAIRIDALGGVDALKEIEDAIAEAAKAASVAGLDRVYAWRVPAAKGMGKLPSVTLGGMYAYLPFNGGGDGSPGVPPVVKHVVPKQAQYDAEHQFTTQYRLLEKRKRAVEERREEVREEVWATLRRFTTVAKLLKVWPAAAELLPDEDGEAKPQLPAVRTGDLNSLIGLPTKGAK